MLPEEIKEQTEDEIIDLLKSVSRIYTVFQKGIPEADIDAQEMLEAVNKTKNCRHLWSLRLH